MAPVEALVISEGSMLKKHIGVCLLGTALVSTSVLAQTATSPAQQGTAAPAARTGQFMPSLQSGQWRASKLIGVDIYGYDNDNRNDRDKIGDVNEVILDRNGNVDAVVVGVGGFLGIGEKDVAIPFKSVEWRYDDRDMRTSSTAPAGARTDRTAAASPDAPAVTGTTAPAPADRPAGTATRSDRNDRVAQGYPDRGYIRWSKADLQNAPTFRYDPDDARRDTERRTDRPSTNAPANPAPRQ
jgi:PRC-barrel domain